MIDMLKESILHLILVYINLSIETVMHDRHFKCYDVLDVEPLHRIQLVGPLCLSLGGQLNENA